MRREGGREGEGRRGGGGGREGRGEKGRRGRVESIYTHAVVAQ